MQREQDNNPSGGTLLSYWTSILSSDGTNLLPFVPITRQPNSDINQELDLQMILRCSDIRPLPIDQSNVSQIEDDTEDEEKEIDEFDVKKFCFQLNSLKLSIDEIQKRIDESESKKASIEVGTEEVIDKMRQLEIFPDELDVIYQILTTNRDRVIESLNIQGLHQTKAKINRKLTKRTPILKQMRDELLQSSDQSNATDVSNEVNSQVICSICYTNKINIAFVPCGHTFCQQCARKVSTQCFICNQRIANVMHIYL